jgi:hypothetical protein
VAGGIVEVLEAMLKGFARVEALYELTHFLQGLVAMLRVAADLLTGSAEGAVEAVSSRSGILRSLTSRMPLRFVLEELERPLQYPELFLGSAAGL